MGKTLTEIIDDDLGYKIIDLYNNGMNFNEITKALNNIISRPSVTKYLVDKGLYKPKSSSPTRYTEEDIETIKKLYNENKYDEIASLYPKLIGNGLRSFCSRHNIKKEGYFWSDEDIQWLKENYYKKSKEELIEHYNGKYNYKTIRSAAGRLEITVSRDWSEEEEQILKDNYSYISIEEVMKLLPNRTIASIRHHARICGLKSKYHLRKYTEEQNQFIIDNWQNMSDDELGEAIGKNGYAVQQQRNKLGFHRHNTDYSNYYDLIKFFRGQIVPWKTKSMQKCNYRCIITNDKNFVIHHLYSFNLIIKEAFEIIQDEIGLGSGNIQDYTFEQLEKMKEIFLRVHDKYPLGVCIRKDIHNLFHRVYGSGGNNETQWNKFVEDLKKGVYSNEITL